MVAAVPLSSISRAEGAAEPVGRQRETQDSDTVARGGGHSSHTHHTAETKNRSHAIKISSVANACVATSEEKCIAKENRRECRGTGLPDHHSN